MKYDSLAQIEAKFKTDAASQLTPFSATVAGEDLKLNGLLYTPTRTGYYYPSIYTKQRIVLHFTAGNLRSDILSLTRQDFHVSVAFVVARDGTIYQLHPSKNWSGHIGAGVGNQGTGNREDKASIGIELSNYGLVIPRDGNMETIYSRVKNKETGKTGPIDLYCKESQTEAYTKLSTAFRENQYFPNYTPEQVESTIILLRFLTAKYDIPRQFLPKEKRFVTTNDVVNFKGIVSHVNYRSSGKWDIGPAFDWETLITGVQAPTFSPTLSRSSRGGVSRSATKAVKEEEIDAIYEKLHKTSTERGLDVETIEATDNEGYNPNDYDKVSLKEKQVSPSGKLFGLLVGINKYEKIRNLNGAVADVTRMQVYIEGRADIESDIRILTDEDASKKNIVSAFTKHLSKAGKDDTILFFYSGHGTQEDASPLWDETDDALECLVCHDKGAKKSSDHLLADKELRYLLHQLYQKTKAHIVLLMDCCHSGDNSRGALQIITSGDKKAQKKFIVTDSDTGKFPKRQWKDFVFGKDIKEPARKIANIHRILPEAPHVQIAACESNQSAIEYGSEGVFTRNLLAILNAGGGNIPYSNLHSRLAQVMRFTEEQTPKLYAPLLFSNLLNRGFLNVEVSAGERVAEVTFNEAKGWQLNKGAIHNMQESTEVTVLNSGNKSKKINAKISTVYIDYSLVDLGANLDKKLAHPALVSGLLSRKLFLELNNWHGNPAETKALVEAVLKRAGGYYDFEGKEKNSEHDADYALHLRNGDVIITRPDDPYRPVLRPMLFAKTEDIDPIVTALVHMAQWHFIKELSNKDLQSSLKDEPLSVEVSAKSGSSFKKIPIVNNSVSLKYAKEGKNYSTFFKLKVKNTTDRNLYVAALYLDKNFMSFPGFLPQKVQLLEAGKSVALEFKQSDELEMRLGDQERQYNWPLVTEYFKFIASLEIFEISALTLNALPQPYLLSDKGKEVRGSKGIVLEEDDKVIEINQWQTQLVELVAPNPLYNIVDRSTLDGLLEYEETAMFAAGIYYDVTLDEFGQPSSLTLKKEMKMSPGEKGLISDTKIWLGNTVETFVRNKLYRTLRETSRLRIVAEGDSWFQYPIILKDVLDQLYKVYAIKSYAEAGDTLENYLKKKEYLKGIKEEKPAFFLVSGGGNDILGEQFQHFLQKPTAGDSTPARFLNQKFFDKLKNLEKWYTDMFKELTQKYPDMQIITHSYDYILPVDTVAFPKKTSWLGKYMIKHKIDQQREREQLILFMVDKFNDVLKAAIKPYKKNVTYIDVRGLIKKDGWHDEIHPMDEGFQAIADRFVEVIEKLKKKSSAVSGSVMEDWPTPEEKKPGDKKAEEAKRGTISIHQKQATGDSNVPIELPGKEGKWILVEGEESDYYKRVDEVQFENGGQPPRMEDEEMMDEAGNDGILGDPAVPKTPATKRHTRGIMKNGGSHGGTKRAAKKSFSKKSVTKKFATKKLATKKTATKKSGAKKSKRSMSVKKGFRQGQMDYLIPGEMILGEVTKCMIRIAGEEVTRSEIRISAASEHTTIEIANEMSVKLIDSAGGKDFKIVPLNTEKQSIDEGKFSEWNFNVTPLKPAAGKKGAYILTLRITKHDDTKKKDHPLLEKSILVKNSKTIKIPTRRVVFMAADTGPHLNFDKEAKIIRSLKSKARNEALFQYTKVLDLTVLKLQNILLRENPAVLHYSGHSTTEGILMLGPEHKTILAQPEQLELLFESAKDNLNIECFVLNSCFSGSQANVLKKFSKFIIGTSSKVPDGNALLFSQGFYNGIFNGLDYRKAYTGALAAMAIDLESDDVKGIYNIQPTG